MPFWPSSPGAPSSPKSPISPCASGCFKGHIRTRAHVTTAPVVLEVLGVLDLHGDLMDPNHTNEHTVLTLAMLSQSSQQTYDWASLSPVSWKTVPAQHTLQSTTCCHQQFIREEVSSTHPVSSLSWHTPVTFDTTCSLRHHERHTYSLPTTCGSQFVPGLHPVLPCLWVLCLQTGQSLLSLLWDQCCPKNHVCP